MLNIEQLEEIQADLGNRDPLYKDQNEAEQYLIACMDRHLYEGYYAIKSGVAIEASEADKVLNYLRLRVHLIPNFAGSFNSKVSAILITLANNDQVAKRLSFLPSDVEESVSKHDEQAIKKYLIELSEVMNCSVADLLVTDNELSNSKHLLYDLGAKGLVKYDGHVNFRTGVHQVYRMYGNGGNFAQYDWLNFVFTRFRVDDLDVAGAYHALKLIWDGFYSSFKGLHDVGDLSKLSLILGYKELTKDVWQAFYTMKLKGVQNVEDELLYSFCACMQDMIKLYLVVSAKGDFIFTDQRDSLTKLMAISVGNGYSLVSYWKLFLAISGDVGDVLAFRKASSPEQYRGYLQLFEACALYQIGELNSDRMWEQANLGIPELTKYSSESAVINYMSAISTNYFVNFVYFARILTDYANSKDLKIPDRITKIEDVKLRWGLTVQNLLSQISVRSLNLYLIKRLKDYTQQVSYFGKLCNALGLEYPQLMHSLKLDDVFSKGVMAYAGSDNDLIMKSLANLIYYFLSTNTRYLAKLNKQDGKLVQVYYLMRAVELRSGNSDLYQASLALGVTDNNVLAGSLSNSLRHRLVSLIVKYAGVILESHDLAGFVSLLHLPSGGKLLDFFVLQDQELVAGLRDDLIKLCRHYKLKPLRYVDPVIATSVVVGLASEEYEDANDVALAKKQEDVKAVAKPKGSGKAGEATEVVVNKPSSKSKGTGKSVEIAKEGKVMHQPNKGTEIKRDKVKSNADSGVKAVYNNGVGAGSKPVDLNEFDQLSKRERLSVALRDLHGIRADLDKSKVVYPPDVVAKVHELEQQCVHLQEVKQTVTANLDHVLEEAKKITERVHVLQELRKEVDKDD